MYRHFWTISEKKNKENIKSEVRFFAQGMLGIVACGAFGYWCITKGLLLILDFATWIVVG